MPSARYSHRANRSRRARVYDALKRAWASVAGGTVADAAATPQTVPDDAPAPHAQDVPPSKVQDDAVAPAASDKETKAHDAANAADTVGDSTRSTHPASDSAATPPQPAAKASGTKENKTTAVAAGSSDIVHKIEEAANGLMFTSETDAPVEAFAWPGGTPFTPEALRAKAHIAADEPLATEDIDRFFRNSTTPRDWHEDAEKEQVRRFTALRDLLKSQLSDITVYRFGSTAIEVYVLGRAPDGSTLGIHTKVVET